MTVLSVDGLSVDIRTPHGILHAVRDVSFDIGVGETLCLIGESGCGKSMTSLAIMDLLPRNAERRAAHVRYDGRDCLGRSNLSLRKLRGDRIAMIFQEPATALNPVYRIGDQLCEVYRRHRRASRAEARQRAIDLLNKVGIAGAQDRLAQYPHQLSGGMKQRVMIAMALMCRPELIIADEPTTALDVTIQAQILRLLIELQKESEIALLLITHDLGVVARMANRVAVMYAGEIVEQASAEALFRNPRHPYTRGLIASIPVPGEARNPKRLGSIPGVVPSLIGEIEGCAFRERCAVAVSGCSSAIPWHDADGHGYRCVLSANAMQPT